MMWFLPYVVNEDGEGTHIRFCRTNMLLRYDEDDADGEFVDVIALSAARQGQGDGTQCLRMLTGMADLFGVKLTLYARSMDNKPSSTDRLRAWYLRHGFKQCGDYNLPESDPDEVDDDHIGYDLFRDPQAQSACMPTNTHLEETHGQR